MRLPKTTASVLLLAVLAGSVAAQLPRLQDPRQQVQRERLRRELEQRERVDERLRQISFPYNTLPKDAPTPFHLGFGPGLKRMFPLREKLPTYPNNVPGYGGYPGAGKNPGELQRPLAIPGLERPPGRKGRWPSFIDGGVGAKGEPASAQRAVLVQVADRVWVLSPGEGAFVPLAYYDRFAYLQTGSRVEVRGRGEYQVGLHDGAGIRARGPSDLTVLALDDKQISLRLREVKFMWITAKLRPVRITLPDGSEVQFTDTLLYIERRGDRCRISNQGSNPIRFSGEAGTGELSGPMYLSVWTNPPAVASLGHAVSVSGGATVDDGASRDKTTVRGGTGGKAIWSGASFAVGTGATLELRPLRSPNAKMAR